MSRYKNVKKEYSRCPICLGSGKISTGQCPKCKGTGLQIKRVKIKWDVLNVKSLMLSLMF